MPLTGALSRHGLGQSVDASDEKRARTVIARMMARHGAPSIEHYRRVYEQSGVPWPGDEEIRRRHPVAPEA
ncbi:MAG: hypothetical protein ACRDQ4_02935 [Pseudonocardiaceae bacterium]